MTPVWRPTIFSTTEQDAIDAEFAMLCQKYDLSGMLVFARGDRAPDQTPQLSVHVSGSWSLPQKRDIKWALVGTGLAKQGHQLSNRLFRQYLSDRQLHEHTQANVSAK